MSYLINSALPASLTIGGNDYIANLVSFQVSDSSAYRNGVITTTGSIVIGTENGSALEDYDRNDFLRGSSVLFEVTYPSGTTAVHPRGRLKVMSSVYDPESEQVVVEVGCDLIMAKLLDDDDKLLPFEQVPLDETAKTYEGISSSLAAAGMVLWQDSAGTLQTAKYFEGDYYGTYSSGDFVSVRGVTALAVRPLAATAAIPDRVELNYQVPRDSKADDNQGRVDTVTSESQYFFKYPAVVFERNRNATVTLSGISGGGFRNERKLISPGRPGTCGNAPTPPRYGPYTSVPVPGQPYQVQIPAPCSFGYETKQVPQYVPAYRTEIRTTTYDGPAAQVSLAAQSVYGPAVELNSQYYSDKYAYCGSIYASECLPSPCELFGLETVLLGKQETVYTYGEAREVIKTVTTTWRPLLSAAQPTDWRSGVVRGKPQDFDQDLSTRGLNLYKHQVVISEFYKEDNASVQDTTTYTSAVTRGGGIGAATDAYGGIKTREIRRSVSSVTVEVRPDSVNAATTEVVSESTIVDLHGNTGGYVGSNSGPYTLKEDVPAPLLYDQRSSQQAAANEYGDYLVRFIEGDARGLSIGEGLREQIAQNWKPNQPFRYYDPKTDKLMAFRSDACSWGADSTGCVVVTNAIWLADMTGVVTLPSNLLGNSEPDMAGGTPVSPSPPATPEPVVTGDTASGRRFTFHVNIDLNALMSMSPSNVDGIRVPLPGPQQVTMHNTLMVFVSGRIVQPGALVALENDGSLPLENANNPVVDESLIIIDDDVLFPAVTP